MSKILIIHKTNQLKKKLDATALAKHFVEMGTWTKVLFSIAVVTSATIGAFFGF
jgi:hypothetical protein